MLNCAAWSTLLAPSSSASSLSTVMSMTELGEGRIAPLEALPDDYAAVLHKLDEESHKILDFSRNYLTFRPSASRSLGRSVS